MAWKDDAKGVILVIVGVILAGTVMGLGGQLITRAKNGGDSSA